MCLPSQLFHAARVLGPWGCGLIMPVTLAWCQCQGLQGSTTQQFSHCHSSSRGVRSSRGGEGEGVWIKPLCRGWWNATGQDWGPRNPTCDRTWAIDCLVTKAAETFFTRPMSTQQSLRAAARADHAVSNNYCQYKFTLYYKQIFLRCWWKEANRENPYNLNLRNEDDLKNTVCMKWPLLLCQVKKHQLARERSKSLERGPAEGGWSQNQPKGKKGPAWTFGRLEYLSRCLSDPVPCILFEMSEIDKPGALATYLGVYQINLSDCFDKTNSKYSWKFSKVSF